MSWAMATASGVRAPVALAWLLAVSCGLTACTGSSSSTDPTTSAPVTLAPTSPTSPSVPTVTAPDDARSATQKSLAVYRSMWAAFTKAQAIPDPNYPDLSRYATGAALSLLRDGIAADQARGLKGTGAAKLSPEPVEVSPAQKPVKVTIRDCLDSSDTRRVDITPAATPFKDAPGGRRLTIAFVARQDDGSWKVTNVGVRGVGTC